MFRHRLLLEQENVDRWVISYADFITLLMAFFVVMYSVSQINQTKYQSLSQSLLNAFDFKDFTQVQPQGVPTATPQITIPFLFPGTATDEKIIINPPLRTTEKIPVTAPEKPDEQEAKVTAGVTGDPEQLAQQRAFSALKASLNESLGALSDADLVEVSSSENWIEINLPSALLFKSGSDRLGGSAQPILQELSTKLVQSHNLIRVRGYTDNVPIRSERFASNWELSTARALAVMQVLNRYGINPRRMAVEGYGSYAPIASNETEAGRAANRRVVIAISKNQLPPEQRVPQRATVSDGGVKATINPGLAHSEEKEPDFEIIRLPDGGLLIRGRDGAVTTVRDEGGDDESEEEP